MNRTEEIYVEIESTANSNFIMQGISGILGFPYTLFVDAVALFSHYEPLINKIRHIYGLDSLQKDEIVPVLKGSSKEIFTDIILDKIIGQVPIIGVFSNLICAKTLTWRIGLLFAYLSYHNLDITEARVSFIMEAICKYLPMKSTFSFKTPSRKEVNDFMENSCQIIDIN